MTQFSNLRVLVAGLGKSGMAAADFLLKRGARVFIGDEKALAETGNAAWVAARAVQYLQLTADTAPDFDLIVQSPGVPLEKPYFENARRAGVKVTGEVELAAPFLQGPVMGITGANGKTTVTTLAGEMLETSGVDCQVGGNIGRPVTDMVDSSRADQWNVLELSSFQLETVDTFHADTAVLLNITANHLDRHKTMDAYVAAKSRLLETQLTDGVAILNANDAWCRKLAGRARGTVQWFSSAGPVEQGYWIADGWIVRDGKRVFEVSSIGIPGRHNAENVMAAAAASSIAGAKDEALREAAYAFQGVEHRIQFVRELRGVRFYNDSKSTTAEATETAVGAFGGDNLWLIMGGSDKGLDYRHLQPLLRPKARGVLLIGKIAPDLARQLEGLPVVPCGTLDQAVTVAAVNATAGAEVLLSPGTASYDQFQNYEQRGRAFVALVNALN